MHVLSLYGCRLKIKCGNSFSEIEVKGHQPVLAVFHTIKA